jgi:hypothetical protein
MRAISARAECAGAEAVDQVEKLLSLVCSRGRESLLLFGHELIEVIRGQVLPRSKNTD